MSFAPKHINSFFFLGQKALLALPLRLTFLQMKWATANWTIPSPLSPCLSFLSLHAFCLSAAAVSKLNHVTKPAIFDRGVTRHLDLDLPPYPRSVPTMRESGCHVPFSPLCLQVLATPSLFSPPSPS